MDALIRVEPATATTTVTNVVVVITEVNPLVKPVVFDLAPLIIASLVSLGGCSVTAIPNPFYVERGVLARAA